MTAVSVIGLGKLGACMAACFAHRGFPVIGVDIDPRIIELVSRGRPPIFEPGLEEMMANVWGRLQATTDYTGAVHQTDVTFIIVPTPTEDHGGFSLKYVKQAAQEIGRALKEKPSYHLVVLSSTVLPGSTEYGVLPVLERESGKRCREDFGLCYSPEFIALGSVIRDFLNPDFALIGESDTRAGEQLAALYKQVCENDPPVARMNFVNAELTKIAVNTYITVKITFANMLAALCEQLPGGDIDTVTSALGLDSRIGPRYLKGALGYGGPCFPRDNLALAYLARQLGRPATLAEATDTYNRAIVDYLVEKIASYVPDGGIVAVLGVAYKPNTNVIEESQGLQLAERLTAKGLKVVVYDPVAMERARGVLGERVTYAGSLHQCLGQADVVVVANPDREFSAINPEALPIRSRPVVVDVWRILRNRFEHGAQAEYRPIGIGSYDPYLLSRLKEMWDDEESD